LRHCTTHTQDKRIKASTAIQLIADRPSRAFANKRIGT
jgi:hypothetical protein